MFSDEELGQIDKVLEAAKTIVVIQADNPDADSLGSALALEHILSDLGKEVVMYCGVDIPAYLRYLPGWDRVQKDMSSSFDASIIVDASTYTLLEKLNESGQLAWVKAKPCVVIDHHASVERVVDFARPLINRPECSSAGEVIYRIARDLNWEINTGAGQAIMSAILGDTQGLTNQLATADTYKVMSELLEKNVSRVELEELRREYNKMPPDIFRYKAALIGRTNFSADGRVASVVVPQNEINEFSPLYNPAPLIQTDMLQTLGVALAIVFKQYDDGRVTGAIRSNYGYPVAGELATYMGGGGHDYASGFKDTSGSAATEIVEKCLSRASKLLDQVN